MLKLESALLYAEQGLAVLPLYNVFDGNCTCGNLNCKSAGKHPMIPNGVKGATKNPETIKSWWSTYPEANIGIATGEISDIIVLDIDPKNGGEINFEELKNSLDFFPETVQCLTGSGGSHYYFKYPSEKITNRVNILRGIDLRSNNGYVVAPPSGHISGNDYEWEVSSSIFDIEMAEMPQDLIEICIKPKKQVEKEVLGIIPEGSRNSTLIGIAGQLRAKGKE